MPSQNPWGTKAPSQTSRSLFGSIRNSLSRKKSTSSSRTNSSNSGQLPASVTRGIANLNMGNPFQDPVSPTQQTPSSNDAPPAYTPSATGSTLVVPPSIQIAELAASDTPPAPANAANRGEDPYSFLGTFDTVLLIDDSGSMAGRSWKEVSQALSLIAPIITSHDSDGMDLHFLNHKSSQPGEESEGIAPGGYRGVRRAQTVHHLFQSVRPWGGTPTGVRLNDILEPYLALLKRELKAGRKVKPLNLIVITDGVPTDDVESIIIAAAMKLDKLEALPYQVGIQFFQVGNEVGAKEALEELDDALAHENGVRDMVDTITWGGGSSANSLTGDQILKAVLGAVVKRLDRRRASGEISRRR